MQPANSFDVSLDPTSSSIPAESRSASMPLAISFPILFLVAVVSFLLLHYAFPIFVIDNALLAQNPPDPVAVAREKAFSRARLTNSLLAFSTISFIVAIALPASLILTKRIHQNAIRYLIPIAVGSALVSCLGVFFGHLVMELTTSYTLGMTRTFIGHWLVFGFFGLAIGMAVGLAIGGQKLVAQACQQGFITGLIAATLFDLMSVVVPRAQIDSLFPGGVLWGGRDALVVASWVGLLLLPLAIGLRKFGKRTK